MSSFPTDTFTGASGDLDKYISEVWGSKINDFAKSALHFTKFFTDRSEELSDGGDTIHTPGLTAMSSATKSAATAVTLNSPTETSIDLVVNTWNEVSFAIEDREASIFKKSYYVQERYAKNAGYTVAMTLEDAIIALFTSFTSTAGASTSVIVDSDIRKALGIVETAMLDGEEIDGGNVAGFFDRNVFWNQVAGITTYQLQTNSGVADPVMKKPARFVYGVPLYLSSRIAYVSGTTGRVNVFAHKDAIHYATSKLPGQKGLFRVQSNYIPQYLSTITTADIFFGVKMNRVTYGCILYSSAS